MARACGIAVTNAGAEHPGDIGRVLRVREIEVVIEIIAGAIEAQADMQRPAAGRYAPATVRHGKGIVVIAFPLVLPLAIALDLIRMTGQATLHRKLRRIPKGGMVYCGHDCGSGNSSGVLIGYWGLP